ncbi:MAG: tetratricopeptide repeat protein [Polyangia bacterium]
MTRTTKTFRNASLALGLFVMTPAFAAGKAPAPNLPQETKGDPAPDTKVAQDLLSRGRYEDAIRQSKLALGRDERYVPAMIVMAKAYYHLKKYELAGSIVEIGKTIDSGKQKGQNDAECYNLLGFLALNRDDRIGATAGFKKATGADDKFGPGWLNLTAQYLFAKNYDGAVAAGERAVKLMGKSPRAHLNLGSAYRGKMRYADAEKEYRTALELDPNLADAWFDLGILYLDAKEMPGPKGPIDLTEKLNTAISHFNKYKQLAGYKITKDDPVDTYINDCRTQIDREAKRIDRMKRQQDRNKPKDGAAAPGAPAAPAPAAPAPAATTGKK